VEVLRIEHDKKNVSLGEVLSIAATLLFRDSFLIESSALTIVLTNVTLNFAEFYKYF
jgi:hypothetical protein